MLEMMVNWTGKTTVDVRRSSQILDIYCGQLPIGLMLYLIWDMKKREVSRRIPRLSTWITVNWYVIYWNEENNGKKRIRGCCSECGWGYVKFEMLLRHPSVKKVVGSMSMDFRVDWIWIGVLLLLLFHLILDMLLPLWTSGFPFDKEGWASI